MSDELLGNSKDVIAMPAAEVRIALQSILGFTQLIQLGSGLTPSQLRHLGKIESAAGQILAHVSGERVRPGRLVFERIVIDLDAALAGAAARLQPPAEAGGVRLQLERSGLAIVGDREQVEQLLLNLLGWAIRSTPERGRLRVRAHRFGGSVRVAIVDTGIAIPRELTTAKRLAEMMGGELEWAQEAEERTSISVRLPAPPVRG